MKSLKRILLLLLMLSMVAGSFSLKISATELSFIPSNPNATPETRAVLAYLGDLPNHSVNRVLSGQNCGHGDELTDPNGYNAYKRYIEDLHDKTGKYVAILSIDYEYMDIYTPEQLHRANAFLIDYWRKGGLIAINYTPRNPFADGGSGEPQRSDKSRVNLAKLLDPASPYSAVWRRRLDVIAAALAELRDAGVVVLWRPMQEMNGSWFWYGMSPSFKKVWRDMYRTLTVEKQLNNLLWVYDDAEAAEVYRPSYPGDDCVDIVGNNPYSDSFSMECNYKQLLRYHKVFACPEAGFDLSTTQNPKHLMNLIDSLRDHYPMTTYFVEWHNSGPNAMIALVDNLKAKELLDDPWVVTRDEVNWRAYMESK